MKDFDEDYAVADSIYEEYESLLWDLIKDANKSDVSLIKMANKLQEAQAWDESHTKN